MKKNIHMEMQSQEGQDLAATLGPLQISNTGPSKGDKAVVMITRPGGAEVLKNIYDISEIKGEKIILKVRKEKSTKEQEHMAENIVKLIEPQIKLSVTEAVIEALKVKDMETLKELKEKAEKGENVEIKRKRGCLFLGIGGKEVGI